MIRTKFWRTSRMGHDMSCPYGGAGDGFGHIFDAAGDAGFAGGAGMNDEIVGTELRGAGNFVGERGNGVFPLTRVGRRQIDEVVGVDSDGAEAEQGATRAEAIGDIGRDVALVGARPHARAGGKNLKRGAADACGGVERAGGLAGDGGVDANTGATV